MYAANQPIRGSSETEPQQSETDVASVLLVFPEREKLATLSTTVVESRYQERKRLADEEDRQRRDQVVPDRGGRYQAAGRDEIKTALQEGCIGTSTDWKLAYAIGQHESANYTRFPGGFNYWGRKAGRGQPSNGVWRSWSSLRDAAADQCAYLSYRYIDRGLDTLGKMGPVYAGGSTSWAGAVQRYLSQLQ